MTLFKKKLTYEAFGYSYAESILSTHIERLANNSYDWTGQHHDAERLGRELAIFVSSVYLVGLFNLIEKEDMRTRAFGGFMVRLSERYEDFAIDYADNPRITELVEGCTDAWRADANNKRKNESFPTLAPLAVTKITGMSRADAHWAAATEIVYSLLKAVLLTSMDALGDSKTHWRLV